MPEPGVPAELRGMRPTARIMFLLLRHHGAVSRQELIRLSQCDGSMVSIALGELEEAGIVSRRPNPYDRRKNRFVLTDHLATESVQGGARNATGD
jgi:DNA-binding MarR family transcriptional regulator